ncbi:MAG: glycosyltransferase family 2 protein [Clostridia bacterium]|nr:glycosyltransferase family 2 protein [Clostridia bacterium]
MENNINKFNETETAEEISRLKKENKLLEEENRKLRIKTAQQSVQLNNAVSTVKDFQQSTSWRITKPLRMISSLWLLIVKCFFFLKRNGLKATIRRIVRGTPPPVEYKPKDFDEYNRIPDEIRKKQESEKFPKDIKFSIIVPLYNTPEDVLREMIESVLAQTYKNWELCLADGSDDEHDSVETIVSHYSKDDKRIVYKKLEENLGISENTNACMDMATGDYIALFDHDDLLHPSALYKYMQVICEKQADFIYCDEDKFTTLGEGFFDAHFKPDFAVDNLRSNNYICHFTVFKKSLLDVAGKFRKEFDGSQDHDIILRLTEKAEHIVHVPEILYHWRVSAVSVASDPYAKPYTIQAGINAVSEHLERVGLKGTVESSPIHPNVYRIRYDIEDNPLVSILIPNYNHVEELSVCINSILEKSTYENYEIIIIENNSDDETFKYYDTLKTNPKIKVVVYKPEAGFNYSAINNFGAKYANGDYLLLLNNDVEVIAPDWIEEMLMFCQRSDVGAVGAKLYYPDDTIQHAGVILGVLTLAGHAFKNQPRGSNGYFGRASYQQDLSACTAACLMVKKSVFEDIGGFDEKFAVAFNDIDLCMKIRKKDLLIVFTPYAELYHYESKSRGIEDTPEKVARFSGEIQRFRDKWGEELKAGDPYYNPNLTLDREDFSLR